MDSDSKDAVDKDAGGLNEAVIFAESLEILVMALEALHEEAKHLGLEISENRGINLLGSEDAIRGSKLSSSGQVLSVFLHNHLNLKQERGESAKVVVREVLVFWDKARIPTQRQDNILGKVQALHDRWKGLKKNQGRQTQAQRTNK
ncbi:hypothetical protein GWK47_016226 [Chionoecetes opilio]|uniref:Uncharacterized protein n=1 Tax=Chionoecetes opilio TaxID=41210 RepID=A0A8J4XY30_CHIOP|nr:hypothetical protein GWK47_016226 [Chionoecetes opilio]